MSEKISIAFAADDVYMPHTASAMASILSHGDGSEAFAFYILGDSISEASQKKIAELKDIYPFELTFLKPNLESLKTLPVFHYTANTYSRLFLPELLPNVSRLLYLDGDLTVLKPLTPLWNTDLRGKAVGVVPEIPETSRRKNFCRKRLGLSSFVFNSGVLLMDLDVFRKKRLSEKIFAWLTENRERLVFPDQDVLNVILEDEKVRLDFQWNVQIVSQFRFSTLPFVRDTEFLHAVSDPAIVHYVGKVKPWNYLYLDPLGKHYGESLEKTPWKETLRFRPTLKERVVKCWKRFFLYQWLRIAEKKLRNRFT